MSEFIRKQDLIEATRHLPIRITKEEFGWVLWFNISDILDKLPSVELEQKTEKQLLDKEKVIIEPFTTDMTHVGYCMCGYLVNADWSYCPKCGRMIIWGIHYE